MTCMNEYLWTENYTTPSFIAEREGFYTWEENVIIKLKSCPLQSSLFTKENRLLNIWSFVFVCLASTTETERERPENHTLITNFSGSIAPY